MDLIFIESYVSNLLGEDYSTEFIQSKLRELVLKIKAYKEQEEAVDDLSLSLGVVNKYNNYYLNLATEFIAIDEGELDKRANKIYEIIAVLNMIETYLLTVTNGEVSTENPYYKILMQLRIKKEHFKNEKIPWQSVLKNLSARTEEKSMKIKYHLMKKKEELN